MEKNYLIIILLLIGIFFTVTIHPIHAETNTILSKSVYDYTFALNATHNTESPRKVSSYYMIAGETETETFVSTMNINTHNIPKSDLFQDIKIESIKMKLLGVLASGSVENYFLTVHLCVDEYEEIITDLWLGGQLDETLQHTTSGWYATENCTRTTAIDSVIVKSNELPQIYEFDLTNLTRDLINIGARGVVFVITATPIDEEIRAFSLTPLRQTGFLTLASQASDPHYGGNTIGTLSITYSSTTTETVKILQNAVYVVPPMAAILVSLLIHWYGQNKSRKELTNNATNSILKEISENRKALNGKKEYQIIDYEFEDERFLYHVRYTNAFLDDDAYASVLSSGEFLHFRLETQDVLRNIYSRVRDHNEQITYSNQTEDKAQLENRENPLAVLTRYDLNLTSLETEINELDSKALKELKKEIKNNSFFLRLKSFLSKL